MKSLKFKAGIFIVVAILAVVFLQTRDSFKSYSVLKSSFDFLNIFGNTATATTSFGDPSASLIKKLAKINKNTKKQTKNKNLIIKSETNTKEIPLGISNPYSQKERDADVKAKLPEVLKDLGLSKDGNGVAGFLVDEIARKHLEAVCNNTTCQKYDFPLTKDLIDLAVGQGKVNLWVVLNAPSGYRFTDGKIRSDGETYLPDGPISRQAYKDYLTALVNYVNTYGRKVSGNSGWYVINWNLSNEVYSEYRETFGKDDKATTAYTNFVIDSAEILRKLSPQSKIVLAGASSTTNLATGHGKFYKQVFSNLKKANLGYEPFDYWESHWFGRAGNYKTNESVNPYGAKDFIQFLKDNGYGDKGFVIRAGATYSGQDLRERKGFMDNYQSEQDQASFLIKRFVYNLGAGVKYIPWSTIYERDKYQGEEHVIFQYTSLIYDGYPDGVSKNEKCVEGWLPCPDPGMGVKKLSYYTYKKLIEVLKGSDWNNIQIVQEKDDVYIYKFIKNGKPVWVAWNDNKTEKPITISGITSSYVKTTEAIPKYESGIDVKNYNNDFDVLVEKVLNGKAVIKLGTKPIYIEESATDKMSLNKKTDDGKIIPLGVNNPFSYPDTDDMSEDCVKNKSALKKTSSYSENHIEINDLKNCIPVAVNHMNNIKDMGVNVISRYFTREYDKDGVFNFGSEDRGSEVAVQLFVEGFGNYFWMAINPVSSKGFVGDINIETHKIIEKNESDKRKIYLPASEAGFTEWQKWLNAVFDYLNDHNALDKLAYIQIGNESDGEYVKKSKIERDNPDDFYWSDYAKLVEKSYDLIKSRSPKTKVAIGAMGTSGVTIDGFQKPVLEYLAGKINGDGIAVNENKKCGGTGCFDAYDYHDFSGFKEYKGRTACLPRNCVNASLTVEKTPEKMKKMLNDSGFFDKKLVIQQGGTYTGQDDKVNNLAEYQSEEDQASYLVKRGIYLLNNGVEQMQFGTYVEHQCQNDTIHGWFTMMGFVYNGIPEKGVKNCEEKEKKENFNKKNCDGQLPCPDPGKGIKKLSYFTQKKLIEILKDNDLNKIESMPSAISDVYVFKTQSNGGKASYFAWWDWWDKCPRPNPAKPEMDVICINKNKPTVFISVGGGIAKVKATEIVPNQDTGNLASKMSYKDIFNDYSEEVKDGKVLIKLGTKPIYIEENI